MNLAELQEIAAKQAKKNERAAKREADAQVKKKEKEAEDLKSSILKRHVPEIEKAIEAAAKRGKFSIYYEFWSTSENTSQYYPAIWAVCDYFKDKGFKAEYESTTHEPFGSDSYYDRTTVDMGISVSWKKNKK